MSNYVKISGWKCQLDENGDFTGGVIPVSDEAMAISNDVLHGATWAAPDAFRSAPEYDAASEAAQRQAQAAVRMNMLTAMMEGDTAYLEKIAAEQADKLLGVTNEREAECRDYAYKFSQSADRLRRREIGFLVLVKEITGSDRCRKVDCVKDGVRRWYPHLVDLLPTAKGAPKGNPQKSRRDRPFDPGAKYR